MNFSDSLYLISSYLIISDGEISDKELSELNTRILSSENLIEQQLKIFSDDEKKISLNQLFSQINNISQQDIDYSLKILFSIVYADGFYDQKEKSFMENIRSELGISPVDFQLAENKIKERLKENRKEQEKSAWTDTLKDTFRALVYELKTEKDKNEEYELLSGSYFKKKIEDIASASKDDLFFVERQMSEYSDILTECFVRLKNESERIEKNKRNNKDVEDFINILEQLNTTTKDEFRVSVDKILEVLNKKKRSIHYFTIAFMGRSKAGKSTLHKVITHEENDNIGEGKLRTTRYNRSWYWENLRIIDTPGIGAPGGKDDAETAKTIIDEADLICYVVSNDSIQETEFNFLNQLKERSKPLFIILNVKDNLEQRPRLKRFINEPLKWKTTEGAESIQGHFDRIRERIDGKYNMDFIEMIPLQLYAANLYFSENGLSGEMKEALLEGSNLKEFIYKIKQSVYRTGSLKKTQNIVDGCGYQINHIHRKLSNTSEIIDKYTNGLTKTKDELTTFIEKEQGKINETIRKIIHNAHNDLRNNAKVFSENNYESKNTSELWKKDEVNKSIYRRLESEVEDAVYHFIDSVKERVEECFDDLNFVFQQSHENLFMGRKIIDWRFFIGIASSIVAGIISILAAMKVAAVLAAAAVLGLPVGALVALAGSIGLLITHLLSSAEEKKKKAIEKLESSIIKLINKQEKEELTKQLGVINENIDKVKNILNNNISVLIDGMDKILSLLKDTITQSEQMENRFNCIFAYRLLQQLGKLDRKGLYEIGIDNIMNQISATRSYKESSLIIESSYTVNQDCVVVARQLTQLEVEFKNK